jgi:ADP-heptose:LPS heptosyltransferase
MKVRFMQRVDYYAGVPLCAALSAIHRLRRLFASKNAKYQGGPVLCIELSEIGSTILGHSALELLKSKARGQVYFVIFEKNAGAMEALGVLPPEQIITIDDRSFLRFAGSSLAALRRIRGLRLEATVDFELFSRFTAMFSYLSGARLRAGFSNHTNEGLYRGNLLTHPVLYNPHQHMALNLLALAEGIGGARSNGVEDGCFVKIDLRSRLLNPPRASISPEQSAKAAELIRSKLTSQEPAAREIDLVLLSPDPGPALPLRGWDPRNYVAVSKALLGHSPKIAIGITGLESSGTLAREIAEGIGAPNRVADFTGATKDLGTLLALFRTARVLISTDGGSAHLASLTALPSVVLFGPETPALYAPLGPGVTTLFAGLACSPCLSAANHRRSDCTENRCLQAITPEMVVAAALRKLDEKQS